MRISINNGPNGITTDFNQGDLFEFPNDPPQISPLSDFFRLEMFEIAPTNPEPFVPARVAWRIVQTDNSVDADDFEWRLIGTGGIGANDIGLEGTADVSFVRRSTIHIQGKRRSGGGFVVLGTSKTVDLDESNCEVVALSQTIFDPLVFAQFTSFVSSTAAIRLRSGAQPSSDWSSQRIRYAFPLELVINNFFNGDLDLKVDMSFGVFRDGARDVLDVTLDVDSDVDFSLTEDILSLGNSSAVARTLNRVLPLVFDCRKTAIEASVARALLDNPLVAPKLALGNRLLDVRINTDLSNGLIEVVCCPPAA